MKDDINLKDFPKKSGVYKLICNGSVIYIGSSNNLYQRMSSHKNCIKKGSDHGCKKGFYLFLQNNHFSVEFELTENYRQREQELIEYFEPIHNEVKAYTGLDKEEYLKQYNEVHRDEMKQYKNQKCNYNGVVLTLQALAKRFQRKGIPHATQEAKKYLIS